MKKAENNETMMKSKVRKLRIENEIKGDGGVKRAVKASVLTVREQFLICNSTAGLARPLRALYHPPRAATSRETAYPLTRRP